MIEIAPHRVCHAVVDVPGSKSHSHRLLIAAALADGVSRLRNILDSEDTRLTVRGLRHMGVRIDSEGTDLIVRGTGGRLSPVPEMDLGNSGTSMRFFAALAALAPGVTVLTGTERMRERPLGDLLDALKQLRVPVASLNRSGCPPVAVTGGPLPGGPVSLKCGVSSQYLSGLLLIGPYTQEGLDIRVTEGPVSKPYIDLTLHVMDAFGVSVEREGYDRFRVPGRRMYRAGVHRAETDASNASYFWAAAAVTGGSVTVRGIRRSARQGDIRLLDHLTAMGCRVDESGEGVTVTGGPLTAIDADMGDMPDMVPTLAVVAAFARGTTSIRNVAHLTAKECDRLTAVATELLRMGCRVECTENALRVTGSPLHGAQIHTYEDHRMAMSFAVAGLAVPGVVIRNPVCVQKSFPGFWSAFRSLRPS